MWLVTPHGRGIPNAVWWSIALAINALVTVVSLTLKRHVVRFAQRWVINPPIRVLVDLGVVPLGWALIETRGRRSGRPRRTPVGNGLIGDTFWIVAEHGHEAGYVRNLEHDPRVRIKARRGFRMQWSSGTAHVLDDDDPYARQRLLGRWHPLRALNAAVVRVMGTNLLTIRVDLDPENPALGLARHRRETSGGSLRARRSSAGLQR